MFDYLPHLLYNTTTQSAGNIRFLSEISGKTGGCLRIPKTQASVLRANRIEKEIRPFALPKEKMYDRRKKIIHSDSKRQI